MRHISNSILKSRHITLPTQVLIVKAMFFPVVVYGCEIWSIKNAEHQRIDAFELLQKILRVPETPVLWPPDAESVYCKRP